ncbi:zinc finger protein 2 homolog isoform X15 [Agrilus planipennis]|uniref:Zinc finger protein 2 homolog isoform X15 n=1 Tax=Agrilus planipennis TaxID=224129 RepID=A0A1W4XGS8_AGRPL|nr:zinc finger protein 2 homolog isoform X15 [Agrilus planipennis]
MVNSVELMQLCRLCLVKDEVNIPIFDNETDVQQIFLKISTCLPVKVTQDDNLPKKICNDCSYKLDLCYQFWNTSANSEKQLVTWLNEVGLSQETLNEAKLQKTESNSTPGLVLKQETIEPESESSHEVVNNVSTESQEYILQQQQLPYQTPAFPFTDDNFVSGESANAGASKTHTNNKRESTLKRKRQAVATVTQPDSDDDVDEDIDDPTETKVAKTEETSDDDRDDDGLNDEESTEFAGVPSTSTDNEQPGPSGIGKNVVDAPFEDFQIKHRCIVGDCVSLSKSVVKSESLLDNFYKCNLCELTSKCEEAVRVHMRNHHKKPSALCRQCLTVFQDTNDCRRHQRKFHARRRFPCKFCNRLFEFNFTLRKHMETHEESRVKMKCDVCEKTFLTEMGLKAHVESHTGENRITCNLCGRNINKAYLERHMQLVHSNSKPFKCNLCPKTFGYENSYKQHIKKHNPDYKPPCYKCEECGRIFSHERSIARHKREQHQEKNRYIVCELCGKALTTVASHRNHLLVHKGEKPHTCEVCGKSFTARNTLKVHKLVHTKEKPFVCRLCNKGFTQSHTLKSHMRSIHTHEKPYKCTICERCFVSKNNLNAHVKSHRVCS